MHNIKKSIAPLLLIQMVHHYNNMWTPNSSINNIWYNVLLQYENKQFAISSLVLTVASNACSGPIRPTQEPTQELCSILLDTLHAPFLTNKMF